MAFFKFRSSNPPGADASAVGVAAPESMEVMRRRAKHRLIGAAVLVVLGVVGFPWLFDSQPRPVAVDIPIDIPDKTKVKPLVLGAVPAVETPASGVAPAEPAASAPTAQSPTSAVPVVTPAPAAMVPSSAEADKARALLDGKVPAVAGERYVVQIGAYSEAAKLREVRQKLEKAGLRTYTQVVDTKDGKRTRVRVGPFTAQAEADKAAVRIKAQDLPAAVLKM